MISNTLTPAPAEVDGGAGLRQSRGDVPGVSARDVKDDDATMNIGV